MPRETPPPAPPPVERAGGQRGRGRCGRRGRAGARGYLLRFRGLGHRHDHPHQPLLIEEFGRRQPRRRGQPAFRDRGLLAGRDVDAVGDLGRELGLAHAGDRERLVGQQKLVGVAARLHRRARHRHGRSADRLRRPCRHRGSRRPAGARRDRRWRTAPAGADRFRGPAAPALNCSSAAASAAKRGTASGSSCSGFGGQEQARRFLERGRGRIRKRRAIHAVQLGRDVRLGQAVIGAVLDAIGEDLLVAFGRR